MKHFSRTFAALLLTFFVLPVHAITVKWTIDSLVFDDGGTASGSFSYNAEFNSYSNVSIVTTTGSVRSGVSYFASTQFLPQDSTYLIAVPLTYYEWPYLEGESVLYLAFASGLTDAGGIVQLKSNSQEVTCEAEFCSAVSRSRHVLSGQISAVPIPAAVWFFASALGLLGWMRRVHR